jgi:predicted Zn finger-like uncharacterized protein
MIIQCIKCNKNFEINSSLIPALGRKIQCGSCNHIWFYTPLIETSYTKHDPIEREFDVEKSDKIKQNDIKSDKINVGKIDNQQKLSINNETNKIIQTKKSTKSNFGRIFSYLLVAIFSFVALIIVLDTLKSPLSYKFPGLELLLYNLFESVKDIFLFIKDLTI